MQSSVTLYMSEVARGEVVESGGKMVELCEEDG